MKLPEKHTRNVIKVHDREPFFADGVAAKETRHKLKKLSWTESYDSDVACDADCFDKFLQFSNDNDAFPVEVLRRKIKENKRKVIKICNYRFRESVTWSECGEKTFRRTRIQRFNLSLIDLAAFIHYDVTCCQPSTTYIKVSFPMQQRRKFLKNDFRVWSFMAFKHAVTRETK